MIVSAQVSVYPLGSDNLAPAIDLAISVLQEYEVDYQIGTMSTLISGEMEAVQAALNAMFSRVAAQYAVVMQCTLSNTCPLSLNSEESGR